MPKTRSFNPRAVPIDSLPGRLLNAFSGGPEVCGHPCEAIGWPASCLCVNDPLLATAAAVAFADQDYAKVALDELRLFVARALPAGTKKAIPIPARSVR
jgi:hypothetical protein